MAKNERKIPGDKVRDSGTIKNAEYNEQAGAGKVVEVGPRLIPLNLDGVNFTTDASTIRALSHQGKCLAVYNTTGTVGSITLGESAAQSSLAAGVTDAGGHVGIPCIPNGWTRISCGKSQWVISSAATLLVFQVDDDTHIMPQ